VRKLKAKENSLGTDNELNLNELQTAKQAGEVFYPLLAAIAGVLDEAAAGQDTYMIIGTNREKTNLLVTINQNGARDWASGLDMQELAVACKHFL